MRSRTPRDEGHESIVEIQGNNPVITQRLIGSNTERIHGIDDMMTLPKLQKNRAERRKTDPTSTDSLEMILGKVGVAFRMDDDCLHILTNKRPKMRRDLNQRNPTNRRNRPVKLEISTNNYTKSIRSPDETGTTIKSALIQFCEHVDAVPYKMKMKKDFNFSRRRKMVRVASNFPKWENGAGSGRGSYSRKKTPSITTISFCFFLVISSFVILLTTPV
jgi:hypothetical protein